MRTIIFISAMTICDAINPKWMPEGQEWFFIIILALAILGDFDEKRDRKIKNK